MYTTTTKVVGGTAEPDETVVRLDAGRKAAIGAFVGSDGRPFCTGTLVAPRIVLSAAHCRSAQRGSRFVVGEDTTRPAGSATVLAVARPPDYRYGEPRSDVLLAYIDRSLPAVPLGITGPPSVGEDVQTVGYGRTDPGERGNTERWWLVEAVREVRADEFAVYSSGMHGLCNGDSGGPALVMRDGDPVVVGTVSYGEADCTGTDTFKRLDVHADWFRDTIAAWVASPPRPMPKLAGVGWVVGLIVAGVAIGMAVRRR